MPRIVKLSELNKKDRKKIQQQTQQEVEERRNNIQNQISFKSNNTRLPINNNQNNFQLPVNNRVQNYNTTNSFPASNNINRNNIGQTQKSTSQKVFETLNPGQKINYDKKSGSEFRTVLPYFRKNFTQGLVEGTAGIAQGQILNASNEAKKISEKSNKDKLKDLNDTFLQTLNPVYGITKKSYEIGQNTLNTLKDKDKNVKEKVANILTNTASGIKDMNNPIGDVVKLTGKTAGVINKDSGNKLLEINEKIEKPLRESREKLQEEGQDYSNAVRMAGTVSNVVGNMTPSIIASRLGGGDTALSQALSLGTMGLSAKGRATQEALDKGAELDKAIKIGDTKAMTEVGTELLTGGLNIFGKGALDNIVERGINKKVANNVLNYLAKQGAGIAGEVGEETISDILNTVIDQGTVDPNATYSMKDWSDTALTTMLSTVVLNALGGAYTPRAYNQNVQEMEQYKAKQDITERINNSNLSEEDRLSMLNYVENEDFTQADYNAMRKTIDVANNQEKLYNNNESEGDIYDATRSNNQYNETEEIRENQPVLSENASTYTGNEITNELYEQNRKEVENTIKEEIKNNFGFNDEVSNDIYSKISQKENLTREDIYEAFDKHRDIIAEEVSDDVKQTVNDIKKTLRTIKIDTSNIKGDIADYKDFYRRNFNRVSMGNDGIGIDVLYKELLSTYPGYFDENIINPTDQLQQIVAWRDFDADELLKPSTYTLTDSDLEPIADTILGYREYLNNIKPKNSNQSSFIMPTVENTKKDNTQKVAPYRTEEQIAKDTSISDIDAIREASKQVETSTLPIAEQKENSLKSENIDRSPTIDYIKKKRSKEKLTAKEIKDALAQKFVNKGHYIDKIAKQTNNNKLTHLYDRTMNTFNEAQISIGDNQVNSKGKVVGKSLVDVFQPSVDAGLETQFEDYLLNLHNIDRYAHEKGIYGEEISASDSRKIADQYEKDYPIFKEWKEDVYKYNDNNLKDLVNNGLVSQNTYDKLKSLYGNYIPTFRDIVDNVSEYLDDTVGSNPLKRATQSDRDILSVKEAMAEQTLMQKKAIRMNNLGLELYKTLGKDSTVLEGIQVDPIAMQTLSGDVIEKATDGSNIFTIFDNGEMKQFKISDELYSAFSKDTLQNRINNSKTAKAILTPIEKMSKAQRELLTTYSVGFAMNNPIKDFQDALFNTKYSGTRFVKNWTKALYNIGTNGTWYENYKNNGGTANTYFDYNKGLLPTKTKNPLKKFANAIKSVNEVLEQAPRLAEYISTIETGGSVDEALYNASEVTTNFKRGGDITKAINKYGVNFLNASVQGLDKAYRNITGQNGVKGYANLLTKATLYQIAPAILNGIIFRDDKDYEDLPEYTKDNYFLFKMGDGKFFRIPKGRVSAVIGGIARRALETSEGKDVDWKSLIDTTINQLAPNNPLTDNIVAPIKQAVDNKSWYGGDIVSTRLQKLPVAEQSDETTDKFSKWLGERLNKSPKKINYVLDQYSGGIGDVLLPMLTPQAENNILEDKFTTDAVIKNKNVSKYYNTLEELQKQNNSSKASDKDKLKYKYISSTSKDMGDLYNQKREVQNSNLSDKEKKEKVREIQKQINNLAEDTLKGLEDKVEIKENTANVNGTKYYKENGEWKKLSDKDIEKSKNIALTTYSDYKNKLSKLSEDEEKIKTADKIQILLDSKYSDKEKKEIYINYINKNDNLYNTINKTGINIDEYLKYKTQNFESDRKKDGTLQGKSKRNKKDKVVKYLNSMDITGNQRLLLYAIQGYKTDNSQKNQLVKYVKSLDLDNKEKLQLLNKFSGFKVYKNGTIKY